MQTIVQNVYIIIFSSYLSFFSQIKSYHREKWCQHSWDKSKLQNQQRVNDRLLTRKYNLIDLKFCKPLLRDDGSTQCAAQPYYTLQRIDYNLKMHREQQGKMLSSLKKGPTTSNLSKCTQCTK